MSALRVRIRAAAERFADELCDAVEASLATQTEWIDQVRSPLGRRRHLAMAKAGTIPSKKEGRLVLIRRRDIDAYLEQCPTARREATPANDDAEEDEDAELERMAQRLGFESAPRIR